MDHAERIKWMEQWCEKNGVSLQLHGECGFGRPCVGIIRNDVYPDYWWYDDDYERIDRNGRVWLPDDAYHKHPCVAVLGRGEGAETQLFEWLRWFDTNGFVVESGSVQGEFSAIDRLFGKDKYVRMVRKSAVKPVSED